MRCAGGRAVWSSHPWPDRCHQPRGREQTQRVLQERDEAMRVLLAGASGAVGTPLTRQLIAAGHQVVGISRSQANAERLRNVGAEAVVADVMDRESLLTAVRGVRADAVMHQLTALRTTKIREAMQGTNALRTTGTAHLLEAARAV